MKILKSLVVFSIISAFAACSGTDVVDSGTYQGTVDKVEAEKTEIYVETDDNKRLELYFNDETQLTQNNQEVPFSSLEKGQRVSVTIEKTGQRLDPISVEILE